MRVLICPDSFKECLSAAQVAEHLAEGFREAMPDVELDLLPLSDGGEGFVETLRGFLQGNVHSLSVSDPLMRPVEASYSIVNGQMALIELAAASGLELLAPHERRALEASTYGTGQLIADALKKGCKRIILGIGGSATTDAGTGIIAALGGRFLDEEGRELPPGGGALAQLARIDLSGLLPELEQAQIEIACDVNNPLTGRRGAAAVFAPQKGASPDEVAMLESALKHFAQMAGSMSGMRVEYISGGGAAGGTGAGLASLLNAPLRPGFALVSALTGLELKIQEADLIITGEGQTDSQTHFGKVPMGVVQLARAKGKPSVIISGALGADHTDLYEFGVSAIFSIQERPVSLSNALQEAPDLLRRAAERIGRLWWSARMH